MRGLRGKALPSVKWSGRCEATSCVDTGFSTRGREGGNVLAWITPALRVPTGGSHSGWLRSTPRPSHCLSNSSIQRRFGASANCRANCAGEVGDMQFVTNVVCLTDVVGEQPPQPATCECALAQVPPQPHADAPGRYAGGRRMRGPLDLLPTTAPLVHLRPPSPLSHLAHIPSCDLRFVLLSSSVSVFAGAAAFVSNSPAHPLSVCVVYSARREASRYYVDTLIRLACVCVCEGLEV